MAIRSKTEGKTMSFLRIDEGTELYYEVVGKGEPLFLLNGMLANPSVWKRTVLDTLSKHFTCVIQCFRGQDFTRISGAFSFEDIVADLNRLVDHLGFDRVHLLGDALGVSVALAFAHDHPEKVGKLVLSGGASMSDHNLLLKLKSFYQVLERTDLGVFFDVLYPNIFCHAFIDGDLAIYDKEKTATIVDKNKEDMLQLMRAIFSRDVKRDVRKIENQTLVIHGLKDGLIRPEHGRNLVALLPHAQLVEVNCGHVIFREMPERYAELVVSFISGQSAFSGAVATRSAAGAARQC